MENKLKSYQILEKIFELYKIAQQIQANTKKIDSISNPAGTTSKTVEFTKKKNLNN